MKSILISIKPEFVAKILNGEKTIEVRKNAPKCDLPIDVYIYCTRGGALYIMRDMFKKNCYKAVYGKREHKTAYKCDLSRHVVAKFTLRKVEEIVSCIIKEWGDDPWETRMSLRLKNTDDDGFDDNLIFKSGFDGAYGELHKYLRFPFSSRKGAGVSPDFKEGVVYGYAWHISDLVIFDEPKMLSKRPPQSWCYMEEKE